MSTETQTATPFAFLSQPPQRKRSARPVPPAPVCINLPLPLTPPAPVQRRRSSTFTAISNWASAVQPGSPSRSPKSPRRRPSVSSTRRRPSITHCRAASGSFLHIDSPKSAGLRTSPCGKDFEQEIDLTNLGYAQVFINLPYTPATPSPFRTDNKNAYAHIPIPPIPATPPAKTRKLNRFRSLSILKPTRGRSKSVSSNGPPSPSKSVKSSRSKSRSKPSSPIKASAANNKAVMASKKAKYSVMKAKNLPPTLANELALMQFMDGGSMNSQAKRVMHAQAKQAAPQGATGPIAGVGDVFRDENGNLWWDQEEEWEYAHLLGGDKPASPSKTWVSFDAQEVDKENAMDVDTDMGRRVSVGSQDSDLDTRFLVTTEEQGQDDLTLFGSALVPLVMTKPAMSVLAIPAKSRRVAKHLRKFPTADLDAFTLSSASISTSGDRKRGTARRRPAPLKLVHPHVLTTHTATNSPLSNARNDFLADSFAPSPATPGPGPASAPATRTTMQVKRMGIVKKASRLNVRALFGKN